MKKFSILAFCLGLWLLIPALCAAAPALGEFKAQSSLYQPLNAIISFKDIKGIPAKEITAQLAAPEVFKKHNVDLTDFVGKLQLQVDVDQTGVPVIKVTSQAPVTDPYLILLVQSKIQGKEFTKKYTLLLDPATTTAKPAQAVSPAPVKPVVPTKSAPQAAATSNSKFINFSLMDAFFKKPNNSNSVANSSAKITNNVATPVPEKTTIATPPSAATVKIIENKPVVPVASAPVPRSKVIENKPAMNASVQTATSSIPAAPTAKVAETTPIDTAVDTFAITTINNTLTDPVAAPAAKAVENKPTVDTSAPTTKAARSAPSQPAMDFDSAANTFAQITIHDTLADPMSAPTPKTTVTPMKTGGVINNIAKQSAAVVSAPAAISIPFPKIDERVTVLQYIIGRALSLTLGLPLETISSLPQGIFSAPYMAPQQDEVV